MTPKFSIIMPVYNAEKYLQSTLDSIICQSFENFEIICVDDGSSDSSLEILDNISKRDARLRIITQTNSGAGVARNNGISQARGEYVLCLDSDDEFSNSNVLSILDNLTQAEECDLYIFGFNRFNDGSTELDEYKIANFDKKGLPLKSLRVAQEEVKYFCEEYKNNVKMFIHNWIAPWNKVYRKTFLKRIDAKFDTIRSVEDRTFHFQTVTKSKRTMMIDLPVINYRLNVAGSLTNNFNVKKLLNHISAYHSIVANTNLETEEEKKAFFISTVSDVFTFYCKSVESEKESVFLKMQEFFRDISDDFVGCQNVYDRHSIFYDIAIGLTLPYGDPEKQLIPVVFATNENYAPYAGVAIQSLIENCDKNVNYQVYVFYTKLSSSTVHRLESMSTDNVHIQGVNVISYIPGRSSMYQQAYYSVEMYYRMLIAEVLPLFDRVVYLDCDIVVLDDVRKLYDISNFENNELIAAGLDMNIDEASEEYISSLGTKDPKKYINSGILVLNTKLIREEKTFGDINTFLNKHNKLLFPDQDAINVLCDGRIHIFDKYWNYQWAAIFGKYAPGISNLPYAVLHFTTGVKPWNNPNMPLSDKFWEYARNTPFYEQILYKMGGAI